MTHQESAWDGELQLKPSGTSYETEIGKTVATTLEIPNIVLDYLRFFGVAITPRIVGKICREQEVGYYMVPPRASARAVIRDLMKSENTLIRLVLRVSSRVNSQIVP